MNHFDYLEEQLC